MSRLAKPTYRPVDDGPSVGGATTVARTVGVGVGGLGVGDGVTVAGAPLSAMPMAAITSLTVMVPSPSASPGGQALNGAWSRTTRTMIVTSSMVTAPSPPQSPTNAALGRGAAISAAHNTSMLA